MSTVSTKKKISPRARIILIGIGVVALAVLILHIWFINNARGIIKSIVNEKSNGTIALELRNVRFNFFTNRMRIEAGDLHSTDTLTEPNSYGVTFTSLTLRVRSFWPLLLQRDLMLDSIRIENPLIQIKQWRKDTTSVNQEDLSVAEQMGRVYNSMLDVLKDFGVRRIIVDNASIKLENKMKKDSYPVWITNINLNVLRNPDNNSNKILRDEAVNLTSTDQTIGLPNGRHRLSFKNFRLQLFRKRIELDSCTITARPKGNSTSTYKIFFEKLALVGVDFDALGKQNLIKADTVLCESPSFNFKIVPTEADKKKKTDPEKIIRELTSDLDLAYVGVKNAGIYLNIAGPKPRSVFNSGKDNFEMRGLKIKSDSSAPVSVQQFDMLVRDYQLYNVDSSAIFSFDSIHFKNKKIELTNFSVVTTPSRYKMKSIRDFRFPQFVLTGLDWYELIFDQNVVAKEAMLVNPVINYTKRTPAAESNTNFFATLQNMDSLMTLERLTILNGTLNLNFGKATTLALQQVNLNLSSNKFMSATNQDGLRRAVDFFSMSKGVLHRKDLTATLVNVKYLPNNIVNADQLLLNSSNNNIKAQIDGVFINNMLLDDRTETIYADGLQWQSASVQLNTLTQNTTNDKGVEGSFRIRNIKGANTNLTLSNGITTISSSVQAVRLDSLVKLTNGAALAAGVYFTGNLFKLQNNRTKVDALVDDIGVESMVLQNEARDITATGITWNNATLDVTATANFNADKDNNGTLNFKDIRGRNTAIKMLNKGKLLTTLITEVDAAAIAKNGNGPFTTDQLLIAGRQFEMTDSLSEARVETFRVQDGNPSWLDDLSYKKLKGSSTGSFSAPRIDFNVNLNSFFAGRYQVNNAALIKPDIQLVNIARQNNVTDGPADSANVPLPFLTIDTFTIKQPDITIVNKLHDSSTTIRIPRDTSNQMTLGELAMDSAGMKIRSATVHAASATFTNTLGQVFGVSNGFADVTLSNLSFNNTTNPGWKAFVDKLIVLRPDTLKFGTDNQFLALESANAQNISLSSVNMQNLPLFLRQNSTASLSLLNGQYNTSNDRYSWSNATYDRNTLSFKVDSFAYRPANTLEFELQNAPYERDYTTFESGGITLAGFDLDTYRNTKAIIARSIKLETPYLKIYRDKLLPDAPASLKALPTKALQNLSTLVSIDSIIVKEGGISYTEKHDKSRREGTLLLTHVNGSAVNIKSKALAPKDSLVLNVTAQLMDRARIQLNIAEAYVDTAYGFTVNLSMQPTPLSILNPLMVPLSNLKFASGLVDSLQLNAVAREHFAVGNMEMFYNDLKIKLVKNGRPDQYGFKTNLLSFIANTFIIKNRNTDNNAQIYVDRLRDKSFFNYLLKIIFKGMGTSVGAGSNRKNMRAYRNRLEDASLPPTFLDSVIAPANNIEP